MAHRENYHIDPAKVGNGYFVLEGNESKHAIRVCRNGIGDEIAAVDGLGNAYTGKIDRIEANSCRVKIVDTAFFLNEPTLRLTLAHVLPKASHFDLVIEKGTELGISSFVPLSSEYSVGQAGNRIERWQKKALAAMKQCLRSYCPIIHQVHSFKDYVKICPKPAFIALKTDDNRAEASLQEYTQATLFVGPEGGFSGKELEYAKANGVIPFDLGSRRLRSETAGLVGAAKLLILSHDI